MMSAQEELEANCPPLVTFQESLQAMFSSRLGSQARQLAVEATKLPPMAVYQFNGLSRLTKVTLTFGLGALVWISLVKLARHTTSTRQKTQPPAKSRRRVRTLSNTSYSDWRLGSEISEVSTVSRPSYNWVELQKNSVSDQDSVVSNTTLVDGVTQLAPQQLGLMGLEALETVIGYWEDALAAYNPTANNLVLTTSEETMFTKSIEDILEAAYELQENSERLFIHQNSVLNKKELAMKAKLDLMDCETDHASNRLGSEKSKRMHTLSVSTLEEVSFVSAEETVADLRDFDDLPEVPILSAEKMALYQSALDLYETSGIPYRVMRTEFVGCSSDLEYLAKLHCLRMAFTNIMKEYENRQWWVDSGRLILGQLLVKSDKDPKEFVLAFDDMLEFLAEDGMEKQMEEELKSRNVKCINFFDICLDYILIDSFEDLESPPSSVLAVMKNRWLSNSFKESALHTAIWSVFQAKRRLLQFPNGFKARFYNVSEILTPTLAWAFFGPDEHLCHLMNEFKEQVLGFLRDIFSFGKVDFSDVLSLSESVMRLARARLDLVKRKLDCGGRGDSEGSGIS